MLRQLWNEAIYHAWSKKYIPTSKACLTEDKTCRMPCRGGETKRRGDERRTVASEKGNWAHRRFIEIKVKFLFSYLGILVHTKTLNSVKRKHASETAISGSPWEYCLHCYVLVMPLHGVSVIIQCLHVNWIDTFKKCNKARRKAQPRFRKVSTLKNSPRTV